MNVAAGKKVLIFPSGTEIGLEIREALKDVRGLELYSANSGVSNHAPFVFKRHFVLPGVEGDGWLAALNGLVAREGINYIFPAHDEVVTVLSEKAALIKAAVITSPAATCAVCRSKTKTYEMFSGLLPVPKLYRSPSEVRSYPVFVKPDRGQGSQGAERADNEYALRGMLEGKPQQLILENLPGKEYTVDCFSDRRKGILFCRGRERVRVRSGISMNSRPAGDEENRVFRKYADVVTSRLELHGAWFFQVKQDAAGEYKLLEVAPRIGGTMAVHRVLGVNFPLLSIYEREGIDARIDTNPVNVEIDRALTNRYRHDLSYGKVYVDMDDTLIAGGAVNASLVKFLYQAFNRGCRLVLISRTDGDARATLRKYRLEGLFDEVVALRKDQAKAAYIDPEGAIFIDDSFNERMSVKDALGVPTFDCSMIELLMDERV